MIKSTLEVWTRAFTRKILPWQVFVSSFSSYFSTCNSPWLLSPLLPCSICPWVSWFSWVPLLLLRISESNFFVLHAHVLLQILKKRRDDKHPFYSQVSSYRWLSLNHASVFFKKSLALLSLNTNTSYTRYKRPIFFTLVYCVCRISSFVIYGVESTFVV